MRHRLAATLLTHRDAVVLGVVEHRRTHTVLVLTIFTSCCVQTVHCCSARGVWVCPGNSVLVVIRLVCLLMVRSVQHNSRRQDQAWLQHCLGLFVGGGGGRHHRDGDSGVSCILE